MMHVLQTWTEFLCAGFHFQNHKFRLLKSNIEVRKDTSEFLTATLLSIHTIALEIGWSWNIFSLHNFAQCSSSRLLLIGQRKVKGENLKFMSDLQANHFTLNFSSMGLYSEIFSISKIFDPCSLIKQVINHRKVWSVNFKFKTGLRSSHWWLVSNTDCSKNLGTKNLKIVQSNSSLHSVKFCFLFAAVLDTSFGHLNSAS